MKKYNMIAIMQKWIDSPEGQTFLNYAYSWGAAIVILGTLFKLTHMPSANLWLFLGMGTEVVVFFISGFDNPSRSTREQRQACPDRHDAARQAFSQGDGIKINDITGAGLEDLGQTCRELRKAYAEHLEKAQGMMLTSEVMDKELDSLAHNLSRLNRLYARMLEAVTDR